MQGFSPKLPLIRDNTDGLYHMNKNAVESIKQDLKMLILTSPGERVMIPDYGVGIKKILFEQNTRNTRDGIINLIRTQASRYMNFISVDDISIITDIYNENMITVSIYYSIPGLANSEELQIALSK